MKERLLNSNLISFIMKSTTVKPKGIKEAACPSTTRAVWKVPGYPLKAWHKEILSTKLIEFRTRAALKILIVIKINCAVTCDVLNEATINKISAVIVRISAMNEYPK